MAIPEINPNDIARAPQEINPADLAVSRVPEINPGDIVGGPSAESGVDVEGTKELIEQTVRLGAKITGQPDPRPPLKPGQYTTQEGVVTDERRPVAGPNTITTQEGAFNIVGKPEGAFAESTPGDEQPVNMQKELTLEKLGQGAKQVAGEVLAPVNMALKPVGFMAEIAQKYALRPFMVGMTKQMHKNAHPDLYPDADFKGTPEEWERMHEFDYGKTPKSDADREIAARYRGTPWAQDVKPAKSVVPSPVESVGRALGSSFTGEQGRLSKEQEAMATPGLANASFQLPFMDEHNMSEVLHGTADFAGELPFWTIGSSAVERSLHLQAKGAAKAAGAIAKSEATAAKIAEGGLPGLAKATSMTPKQAAGKFAKEAAKAEGKSFAIQSAVVASKNDEDVATAAAGGYVTGRVLSKLGELLTANKAGKTAALAQSNAKRAASLYQKHGVILPPQTWAEYVAESSTLYKPPAEFKTAPKVGGAAGYKFNDRAEFTFKTVEYGDNGELMDVRYLDNAVTGKRTVVHRAPLKTQSLNSYLASGQPELIRGTKHQGQAYSEYIDWRWGAPEGDLGATYGKAGFTPPEQLQYGQNYKSDKPLTMPEYIEHMEKYVKSGKPKKFKPSDVSSSMEMPATPETPQGPATADLHAPAAVEQQPVTEEMLRTRRYGEKYQPGTVAARGDATVEIAGHDIPHGEEYRRGGTENLRFPFGKAEPVDSFGRRAPTGRMTNVQSARDFENPTPDNVRNQGLLAMEMEGQFDPGQMEGRVGPVEVNYLGEPSEVAGNVHSHMEYEAQLDERNRAFLTKEAIRDDLHKMVRPTAGAHNEPYGKYNSRLRSDGQTDILDGPVTRPLLPDAPVILSADHRTGNVSAMHIPDRTPRTDTLSERTPVKGDVVQMPHSEAPHVVVEERGETVSLLGPDGKKVTVPKASVSLADEKLLDSVIHTKNHADLSKLGKLDIERVMKAMGLDNPVEAKSVLDLLWAQKKIRPTMRPGEFEPIGMGKGAENHGVVDSAIKKGGQPYDVIVYYDVAPDGQGKTGVIRGTDPAKPGNYLLEITDEAPTFQNITGAHVQKASAAGMKPNEIAVKTKTISVTADQVRSFVPVLKGYANKSTLLQYLGIHAPTPLPSVLGVSAPMPADVIVLQEHSIKQVSEMMRMHGQLNKILSKPRAAADAIARFWNHEAYLVPLPVRREAITLSVQPGIVKAESARGTEALSKRLGGVLSPVDTEIAQIAKMNASKQGRALSDQEKAMVKFYNAHPEIAQEVRDTVRMGLDRLKSNQQRLAAAGIDTIADLEAQRAMGLEEEYLTNVYLKHMMHHEKFAEFAKKQLPDEWNNAVLALARRPENKGKWLWQLEDSMLEVLGMDIPAARAQLATNPSGDAAKKLRERIQLSDEINAILGKLDSASVQIAHSLAATDSLIVRVDNWNKLAQTPYWSPGPRPDLGPNMGIKVPDLPIYGKARGGRMHESFRFLLEAKPAHVEARSILRSISKFWKFNQVIGGGPVTYMNNQMRMWSGHMMSGGIQSPSDFGTFFDAAKIMMDYKDNPIMNHGSLWKEALDNGVVGVGFAGSEVSKSRNVRKILDAVIKQKGSSKDFWELAGTLGDHVKGGAQDVGEIYDAMDNLNKFTAYINIRKRNLAKGMSLDDAVADAQLKCRQSYPYFDQIAPTFEKMRQGSISGVAPFMSSHAEDMRIRGTMLMRMMREPDLIARMAVWAGVGGALAMLVREQRRANGITDDMVRKALDQPKLQSQAYRPGRFVLPTRDSKGRLQLGDLTQYESSLIMFQRHETDFLPAAIVRNFAQGFFGENSITGTGIDLTMNWATGIVPLSPLLNPGNRPGEDGYINLAAKMAQAGGVPQMPLKAWDAYQKTQPGPISIKQVLEQEQWTDEEAMYKFWGLPYAGPVGKRTATGRARELQQNTRNMQGQAVQSIMKTPPGQKRNDLLDAKIKDLRRMIEEYNESKK